MSWVVGILVVITVALLGRELRRWQRTRGVRASPSGHHPPLLRRPESRVWGDVPSRDESTAGAIGGSNAEPARLHRHESVVGSSTTGSATTVFVVRVEPSRPGRATELSLALTMLVGSRLVSAAGDTGRVTHWRAGAFLVTVESLTEADSIAMKKSLEAAVSSAPLVSSAGELMGVSCCVSFARFAPGDPALAAPSLEPLVERVRVA